MLPFADSPHGRLTPSTASFTRWTRRPRAGGGPLPHAARLQAGKDACSRCRPLAAGRSFHAGPRRGLPRLPYLGGVAALRGFSPLRYLTLAIGDRRAVGHGMGGRAPGEARPLPGPSLASDPMPLWGTGTATRRRAYRNGTIRAEWQCVRYARGRVAVRLTLPLRGERTARCVSHCHPASSVPKRYDQG